jgi:5-methylcytosine-specific restriction endonuclease McrA
MAGGKLPGLKKQAIGFTVRGRQTWNELMPSDKSTKSGKMEQLVRDARRKRRLREQGYRERALKLFPPVCAHCGREFAGKRLRELTVHHKDHNHDNNPPDGSNWELLCIYCHDNEHARDQVADWYEGGADETEPDDALSHRPFASLGDLLKKNS